MAHFQLEGLPLQRLKGHSAQHLTENSCLMELRMINAIIKHLPFSPVSSMDSEEWKGKQWKGTVRLPETDFSHMHFFLNLGMTHMWGGSHCDCQHARPSVSAWIEISKTEKRWLCRASVPTSGLTPVTKSICNTLPVKQFDSLFLHSWALSTGSEKQRSILHSECVCVWVCEFPLKGPGEAGGWQEHLDEHPKKTCTHTHLQRWTKTLERQRLRPVGKFPVGVFYIYLKAMIS